MFSILLALAGFGTIWAHDSTYVPDPQMGALMGDKGPLLSDIVLAKTRLSWVAAALCAGAMYDKEWLKDQINVLKDTEDPDPFFNVYGYNPSVGLDQNEQIPASWERTKALENYKVDPLAPWWHAGYTAAIWSKLEKDRKPMEDRQPCDALTYFTGQQCVRALPKGEASPNKILTIIEKNVAKQPMVLTAGYKAAKLVKGRSYALVKADKDGDKMTLTLCDPTDVDAKSFVWEDIKTDIDHVSYFPTWRDRV